MKNRVSRRSFLKHTAAAGAGTAVAHCARPVPLLGADVAPQVLAAVLLQRRQAS